jgi:hypothetical protein
MGKGDGGEHPGGGHPDKDGGHPGMGHQDGGREGMGHPGKPDAAAHGNGH